MPSIDSIPKKLSNKNEKKELFKNDMSDIMKLLENSNYQDSSISNI